MKEENGTMKKANSRRGRAVLPAVAVPLALVTVLSCGHVDPSEGATSATAEAVGGTAGLRSRSNSLIAMPYNTYFADIDGDGIAELVTTTSNQLFVTRADFAGNGVGHHYFDQPVREIAVGRFSGTSSKQELCAYLENDWFECIRWVSPDLGFETWLSTGGSHPTSPSIVQPTRSERMMVADFNADGKEDLMVHDPVAGTVRFMSVATNLGCDPVLGCGPVFAPIDVRPGDLYTAKEVGFTLGNKEIYAGELGGTSDLADLLVVDRTTGKVYQFNAVAKTETIRGDGTISTSTYTTFEIAGKTCGGDVGTGDALAIANVDGSSTDALVAYNPVSGETRFQRGISSCQLGTVSMLPSQLVGSADAGSRPFFAKLSTWPGEPGTDVREDYFFYHAGLQQYVRSDARYSDGNTYWWAFNKGIRRFDQEFAALDPVHEWQVVMCTDSDLPAQSWYTLANFQWLYGKEGRNTPAMYNFFKDMSYGRENYVASVVGPYATNLPESAATPRIDRWQACTAAAGVDAASHYRVLVLTNGEDDFGYIPTLNQSTVSGWQATWTGGPVHEMGHTLGLVHAHGDQSTDPYWCGGDPEYCDDYDSMGYVYGMAYVYGTDFKNGGNGLSVTPAYDAVSRLVLGWVPAARQYNMVGDGSGTTWSFQMAALERPESPGALVATIQPTMDSQDSYVIEFRTKSGRWDLGIPRDGILIHHMIGRDGYLQSVDHPDFQPGESFSPVEGVTITVDSFDAAAGIASITVST